MHALYCRLLRINHAHATDRDATTGHGDPLAPTPRPDEPQTDNAVPAPGPPAADDNRPSTQMANIPRLLRAGYSIEQTAAVTGVPVALVQLVQTEIARTTSGATGQPAQPRVTEHTQAARRRRRIASAIALVAIANIVIGLIASLEHNNTLGLVSIVCAVLLTLAVFAFARRGRPRRPPIDGR